MDFISSPLHYKLYCMALSDIQS